MKNKNAIVLTSVTLIAVMLTASMPSIYAQSNPATHAGDPIPAGGPPGTLFTMQSNQNLLGGGGTTDYHHFRVGVLFDNVPLSLFPTDPAGGLAWNPDPEDTFYEWQDCAGNPGTAGHLDVGLQQSQIFFDDNFIAGNGFGSGAGQPGATTAVFLPSPPAGAFHTTPTANGILYDACNEWRTVDQFGTNGPADGDSTLVPSNGPARYVFIIWTFVDFDSDQTYDPNDTPPEVDATVTRSFEIVEDRVGGFYMTTPDTTTLLVLGAQTNALWILPILGLAGTIIAIRKLEA